MRLTIVLLLLLTFAVSKGQTSISGQVFFKEDNSPIPGANILEKGTQNGTIADKEGRFAISVEKLPTTLEVFFVGMVTKEITIEQDVEIIVELKSDCHKDSFDHQVLGFYLNSGVFNNPYGGEFHLSFPAFWRFTTFKSKIGYQTNFDNSENLIGQFAIDHIIFTCDYELDLKVDYQKVSIGKKIDFTTHSLETHFIVDKNYSKIRYAKFIVGLSKIRYELNSDNSIKSETAPVVGIGTILGEWWRLLIVGKITLLDNHKKYDLEISRNFKRLNTFINYRNFRSYTELSIGVGTSIGYRLKKRSN